MQFGLIIKFAVLLLAQTVRTATIIPKNERCVTAVYTTLNYVSFAGEPAVGLWQTRCQNPLKVTSIFAAAEQYCDKIEQTAGFAQLDSFCREFAHMELLPREIVAENLTEESVRRMRVIEFQELSRAEPIDYPVLVSPRYYDRTFRTIDTWQVEIWAHHAYGYFGYLYWGCILLAGMLYRGFQLASLPRRIQTIGSNSFSMLCSNFWRKTHQWAQTYLIIAFPLKSSSRKVLWFDLPTRIEAIIIFGFWILSILLTCITYPLSTDNIYWPDTTRQLLRYVADRTGIMAFANLPLLWIFAGRNNSFQWATGWSFATFNIFHRHVAWIATMQAVIHTIAYLVLFYQTSENKLWKQLSKSYIIWGTAATAAMVFILPLAVNRIRKQSYEFFLLVHIVLSLVTIVGCFYHIIIFEGEGYEYYLWPVVVIWCFERILRLIRVLYCNFHVHSSRARLQHTSSIAMYDEASNVVRLEVIPGSPAIQPTASNYYYLYQPFRLRGWENHPFTLGSWEYTATEKLRSNGFFKTHDSIDVSQVPLLLSSDHQERENTSLDHARTAVQSPTLIFWIRPYDGWTRSLRDQCLKSINRTIHPTILLEGPYGEPFPIGKYDSTLLIAGGTGIACAIPYIKEHIRQSEANYNDDTESPRRDIRLVWIARESSFIVDVATRELQGAMSREEFSASFYSTSELSSESFKIIPSRHSPETPDIDLDIHSGRPDLRKLVLDHAREASYTDRSTAILVSGPTTMADEVRAAVLCAMRKGYQRIIFREESFSW